MASLTARELVLCTLLGGVLLNWTVGQLMRAPEAPATRRLGQRAWLLVVRLQFKSKADVAAFLAIFAPMADAVSSHEPDTWGYTVSRSDQDSLALMIFERYATKDAYLRRAHPSVRLPARA